MAQVKLEEEAELWDPAEHNSTAVDFSHVKEESELCIKKEPDEFPFHIVKVEDDDEDKVLHQRTTEENRSKTNGEKEAEAGCSSEALTHLQSGSEEDIDSSDTEHSVDYRQEQPPSKRSYAMINNDTRPFKCSECGKGFPRNSELRRHVLIHSGQKPYQCSVCGRECRLKYQLQIHMGIHTGGKPEICSVCKKGYEDYDSLTDHMKTHIEDVTPDETLVYDDDAMRNTDSLVQDVGHDTKPHKCIECGKRFVCNSELQRHVLIHTGQKPFRCSVCEQEFRHKHHLESHMRSHTGERPFSCSVCNKGFSRNYCLTAHMRLHTGERPFVCPVCEKGFTQHSILRDHMKTHPEDWSADQTLLNCSSTMTTDSSVSDLGRDPKPFKCSVCGRAFQRNAYLQNHMLIHTGEKPFRCPVCEKDFRDKGNLKIHMRTHTGEKPFSCPFCQKSFKLKRDLVIHMRLHTGEKPFTCPICKKGFVTNTYLRTHLRTHTGEKPFSCTICKKCFTQKSSLRTHVRGHRTDTSNEGQNVIQSTVA